MQAQTKQTNTTLETVPIETRTSIYQAQFTPMTPARRCLTPNRPSRCTHCYQQSTIVVDCRPHSPRLTSPPGAVNTRPTAVAVYIALADGQCAAAKVSKSRIWDKVPEGRTLIFGDRPTLISLKHSIARVEGNLYAKKSARFVQPISIQYRRVIHTQIYDDSG